MNQTDTYIALKTDFKSWASRWGIWALPIGSLEGRTGGSERAGGEGGEGKGALPLHSSRRLLRSLFALCSDRQMDSAVGGPRPRARETERQGEKPAASKQARTHCAHNYLVMAQGEARGDSQAVPLRASRVHREITLPNSWRTRPQACMSKTRTNLAVNEFHGDGEPFRCNGPSFLRGGKQKVLEASWGLILIRCCS